MTAPAAAQAITFRATGEDAQRMLVCGKTGSGKTTVAVRLAEQARRCVWIDVKGTNDPARLGTLPWPATTPGPLINGPGPGVLLEMLDDAGGHLVVQLADRPDVKDEEQINAVAEAAYAHRNVLLVLDDAMGVLGQQPPYYLNRVIGMGRSLGVGFMGIVTRVHNVPRVLLTQAEHVIAFELHDAGDAERLAREASQDLSAAMDLQRYEHLWLDREARTVQLFNPLTP